MAGLTSCPCGSDKKLDDCCGAILAGQAALTAEALMRSRYTAYVLGNENYLLFSWHPRTRPPQMSLNADMQWLGLTILRTEAGGRNDQQGVVEFVARYKMNGRGFRLHETSRFERFEGRWVYVDGDV